MNRALRIILTIMGTVSFQAAAATPLAHPPTAKRLLVACMNRAMSASKTISYNEATKVCKAQLKTQSATLATASVKPMS